MRDTEGLQTHPCPQGGPRLKGEARGLPLGRSQSDEGEATLPQGISGLLHRDTDPPFGGSQADGRCTASTFGKFTVKWERQSFHSEQVPTLIEETQPFPQGAPSLMGESAPALEDPSIREAM